MMTEPSKSLIETHLLGSRTRQYGIRVDRQDPRAWLQDFPVCPLLQDHQIAHTGIVRARPPFRIVRLQQGGSYFMACFGGEGRILVDGRWQFCRQGTACLLPPRTMNAFHALPGASWDFCWVRYQQPEEQQPVATSHSPVLAAFDAAPLQAAIEGLFHESRTFAAPAQLHHWVELIQSYVMRFARPRRDDSRLWELWRQVAADPGRNWTLQGLAKTGHLSAEHLRRLCRRQLGRTPMQHVTWLRMRAAGELLSGTADTVETIAAKVGYRNPFAFSSTFKKWTGLRPSEFRNRV
ncbi:MAG: AraC family transcriptional regulator [Phycisphaeraceae bacterium]|nr:AraC family transcriptional regulator [Phycisphaeraceae bacterium]